VSESDARSVVRARETIIAPAPAERPGRIRRAAAGAWHVPAAMFFLVRHVRLWPLAALPAALCAVFFVLGLFFGVFSLRAIEELLAPHPGSIPGWMAFGVTLALWIGTLAAGVIAGLALALLLSAPVLDALSRRVERLVRGSVPEGSRGLRWEIVQSLKGSLFLVAAAPLVFVLGLVPVAGPLLGFVWGAYVLAYQETDSPLTRRGLDFARRRHWHRAWRWESLGFGLAGMAVLVVPFANLLLAPALTVGGTRLVLEIEDLD
jgi:CysZ protein